MADREKFEDSSVHNRLTKGENKGTKNKWREERKKERKKANGHFLRNAVALSEA